MKSPVGMDFVLLNDDQTSFESKMSRTNWSSRRFADSLGLWRMEADVELMHRGHVHRTRFLLLSSLFIGNLGSWSSRGKISAIHEMIG